MTGGEYHCDRCGGTKRLFFVRGPAQITLSVTLVAVVILLRYILPDGWPKFVALSIGIVAALLPAISLLRIRCLVCEPEWQNKMWR